MNGGNEADWEFWQVLLGRMNLEHFAKNKRMKSMKKNVSIFVETERIKI
jgi:hypothetical protein